MSLRRLRAQIDRVDRQLLRLLSRRAELALRVGRIKRQRGVPVFDSRREQRVLRQMARLNRGPLATASVRKIFQEILRWSRRLEVRKSPR